jgi:hypothetical protein
MPSIVDINIILWRDIIMSIVTVSSNNTVIYNFYVFFYKT